MDHLFFESVADDGQWLLGPVIGGHLDVRLERPDQGDQQAAAGRGQGGCHLPEQGQRMGAAVQQVEGADHVVGALVPRFHRLHAVGSKQKSIKSSFKHPIHCNDIKVGREKTRTLDGKKNGRCRSGMQLRCSSRLFVIKISSETAGFVCVSLCRPEI
jgi:hypothetical protein